MGLSSSKFMALSDEIKNLKNQINIIQEIDQNHDGAITKEDFIVWKDEQMNKMFQLEQKVETQLNDKYNELLSQYQGKVTEDALYIEQLKKEIQSLKSINESLEKQLMGIQANPETPSTEHVDLHGLSKKKINEFVDQLLSDINVNIAYLPDFVERQIYKNVLSIILGILDNTLNTTSINFMGHQLTISMQPQQDHEEDKNKEIHNNDTVHQTTEDEAF